MKLKEIQEKLGHLLVQRKIFDVKELEKIQKLSNETPEKFEKALLNTGKVTKSQYNRLLEEITGQTSIDPMICSIYPEFIEHISQLIPKDILLQHQSFPIRHEVNTIHLAMANPTETDVIQKFQAMAGCRIRPYSCHLTGILTSIERHFPKTEKPLPKKVEVLSKLEFEDLMEKALTFINRNKEDLQSSKPGVLDTVLKQPAVVKLVQEIMSQAVYLGASDVHFEPLENTFRIRVRVDGVLHTHWSMHENFKYAVIPRLKIMSRMNLNEKSLPQDGRIDYAIIADRAIDTRVSCLPSNFGEKMVIRILEKQKSNLSTETLGLTDNDLLKLKRAIFAPNGLVLVTGPTGSGKTTTLYACLTQVNSDDKCIVTVEDPIEYELFGITQVQCNAEKGLTFGGALRSFLRQDPDIIMVGEMRDLETADIAVKAALTGHLVLSTLHTNDAAGSISRLINLGVEPFLLSSSISLVIAQRLMRKICEACKEPYETPKNRLNQAGIDSKMLRGKKTFVGQGCDECNQTGYKGRIPIFEVLEVNEPIQEQILKRATTTTLAHEAEKHGMRKLRQNAMEKLLEGVSTLDEVIRVTVAEA